MMISLRISIGEINTQTKRHRQGKVNKEKNNTPHTTACRHSHAVKRINVTLSWAAVYIKSHSFHLGSAGKCCKLAQCWTSCTCLRLGFVCFGGKKGDKRFSHLAILLPKIFFLPYNTLKKACINLISDLSTAEGQRQICHHGMVCIKKEGKIYTCSRLLLKKDFGLVSFLMQWVTTLCRQAGRKQFGRKTGGNKEAYSGFHWKNKIIKK